MNNYKPIGARNFRGVTQIQSKLSEEQKKAIEIVGSVLPFKTNNFVVDELIDWDNIPDDPIFQLTFPQREMLTNTSFESISDAINRGVGREKLNNLIRNIRDGLNPHPAGQVEYNIPSHNGSLLNGLQHKYEDTVLFFPSKGQTCHAYCTFCFRWPQFIGEADKKIHMKEVKLLMEYIRQHPEVTDILITGGDPMIMNASSLSEVILPLLNKSSFPNINTIRIGTKSLSFWPYRFLSDDDSDEVLRLFEKIIKSGKHLALMAHFNHPTELSPSPVQQAIRRILCTGAQIRTQSPIMNHINAKSFIWSQLWNEQVKLGCIPYYMFVARDTGAQDYFSVPLIDCVRIYKDAYRNLSGLARTARGPCLSTTPGKVQILDVVYRNNEIFLIVKYIRARTKEWVDNIFNVKVDASTAWLDNLHPISVIENTNILY